MQSALDVYTSFVPIHEHMLASGFHHEGIRATPANMRAASNRAIFPAKPLLQNPQYGNFVHAQFDRRCELPLTCARDHRTTPSGRCCCPEKKISRRGENSRSNAAFAQNCATFSNPQTHRAHRVPMRASKIPEDFFARRVVQRADIRVSVLRFRSVRRTHPDREVLRILRQGCSASRRRSSPHHTRLR